MNSELLCFNEKNELRFSSKAFVCPLIKSTQCKHFDYFSSNPISISHHFAFRDHSLPIAIEIVSNNY